jgi:hypothetical protein
MKIIVVIVLATTCLVTSAFADSTFICGSQNRVAHLTISDPITKNRSFNECNGGVGDDFTNCHSHDYQIQVQEVAITLKINGDELYSKMEMINTGSDTNGFTVLIYKDNAIHLTLKVNDYNPILNLRFMAKGTPGNPVEVGNYSLPCN